MTTYIPANPGFFVLEVHTPAESYSKIDVIGWAIHDGYANPITAENSFEETQSLPILHPSGIVTTFFDAIWQSEQEWWDKVKKI